MSSSTHPHLPSLSLTTLHPPGPDVTHKTYSIYDSDPSTTTNAISAFSAHPNPNIKLFHHCMLVRHPVFIIEQSTPLPEEIDLDDARSWHFLAYDTSTDRPVATLRLVPPPHAWHLLPGSHDGVGGALLPGRKRADGGGDVVTKMHDGKERYVKVGRVAVLKEYRGRGVGDWLMREGMKWAAENAEAFKENGVGEISRWKGLMLLHSQQRAAGFYRHQSFEIDEDLGVWYEIEIPHVAMWKRLDL